MLLLLVIVPYQVAERSSGFERRLLSVRQLDAARYKSAEPRRFIRLKVWALES